MDFGLAHLNWLITIYLCIAVVKKAKIPT